MLQVNASVRKWLRNVQQQERGNDWENESGPVPREPQVDLAVPLPADAWVPEAVGGWSRLPWRFLSEALNVLVDVAYQLRLDLMPLDHLHNLLLLLVEIAVLSSNFLEPLVDVVVKRFH